MLSQKLLVSCYFVLLGYLLPKVNKSTFLQLRKQGFYGVQFWTDLRIAIDNSLKISTFFQVQNVYAYEPFDICAKLHGQVF